ncbi:hypothetical protein [Massilia sp. BSC265]|uniref:hypothetical protein n=1 Tax=Massilia sp. BSC265 TaxID=1549812 RepID=UPI0004E8FC71|nr:hypothetical protein [Massilia sp. BSC265]KFI07806.1 hypothetical protein JN27_09725 [Massilia sp. BSC265]
MKKLIIVSASLAVLAGCAAPGPNYHGSQADARSGDPGQWQVVSVTPVPLGTGARAAAAGETRTTTTYSPAPQRPVVVHSTPWVVQPAPVYVPQPAYVQHHVPHYVPEPVYQPRYYYPPVSIGLGFNFGRGWGHHRGWGGHVGTRFPYHWRR